MSANAITVAKPQETIKMETSGVSGKRPANFGSSRQDAVAFRQAMHVVTACTVKETADAVGISIDSDIELLKFDIAKETNAERKKILQEQLAKKMAAKEKAELANKGANLMVKRVTNLNLKPRVFGKLQNMNVTDLTRK